MFKNNRPFVHSRFDYKRVILFRVTERNETERRETKRNDFVSCFSNYYRDITILRNETIPFRLFPFVSKFLLFVSCFSNFLYEPERDETVPWISNYTQINTKTRNETISFRFVSFRFVPLHVLDLPIIKWYVFIRFLYELCYL